jgi:hypothetical protein
VPNRDPSALGVLTLPERTQNHRYLSGRGAVKRRFALNWTFEGI